MTVLPAVVFWVLTLYFLRQRSWTHPEGTYMRIFAASMALGLAFQVGSIANAVDHWCGIHNLSWWLGYVPCVVGVFFGLLTWLYSCQLSARRAAFILIGTLATQIGLFPLLAAEGEASHEILIHTPVQIAYASSMYLFLALMSLEVLRPIRLRLRAEKLPTGQLRLIISMIAVYFGLAFTFVRTLAVCLASTQSGFLLADGASWTGNVLLALCAVGFGLALTPLRFLAPVAWIWVYCQQQLLLSRLGKLRAELVKLTSPLPWSMASLSDQLLRPSYALYCTLIDILDRRSLFLSQARYDATPRISPSRIEWLFSSLPPSEDWVELLDYFRHHLNGASQP